MLRRRAARDVQLPIEREETRFLLVGMVRIDAKLDEIKAPLTEEDDGEETD
jgi:hypothetical protein